MFHSRLIGTLRFVKLFQKWMFRMLGICNYLILREYLTPNLHKMGTG